MQTVEREKLLQCLLAVQPGLAEREIIEQSSCVVFKGKRVFTYNDEVACSAPARLEVQGAIPAKALIAILGKMPDETLEVEDSEEQIIFHGKKRKAKLRKEAKVQLPIDKIEQPTEWTPLSKHFNDAVDMVRHSASSDKSRFKLTCLHLTPTHLEASDNYQLTRFTLKTGLQAPTLVRKSSLEQMVGMGMTEFAETKTWIHFRNPEKVQLSCRRYVEQYSDRIDEILKAKGTPITLPKGLGGAADRASVFSAEAATENLLRIKLQAGTMWVKGIGEVGSYTENRKVEYDGADLEFVIAPALLVKIAEKFDSAFISESMLRVEGPRWVYVTALGKPKDETAEAEKKTEEEPDVADSDSRGES